MTYVLLIYRTATPSETAVSKALAGHRAVQAEASARGELHAVAQLGAVERAITVKHAGGAHEVTDGPYVETKEWLVGFYLIDCKSEEKAIARAKRISPDPDHAVEIRPIAWRWKE